MNLQEKRETAVWVAHTLFERNKASGSSANLSFRDGDTIYISVSGGCFGRLDVDDFAAVDPAGMPLDHRRASKELELHRALYEKDPAIGAVLHTHSSYATLWSCLPHPDPTDLIPAYTPYLGMKLGKVAEIGYAPPGSEALFALFRAGLRETNGYLLAHHGPIVGGKDLLDAFYALEELEESARLAWELRCTDAPRIG